MSQKEFAFGKKNYSVMIVGIVVLVIGLILMSMDGEEFGEGFLGITLGPLVVLGGFGIQFYAIFAKGKSDKDIVKSSDKSNDELSKLKKEELA